MEAKSFRFITHQSFFAAVEAGDVDSLKEVVEKLSKDESSDGSSLLSHLMTMQNDAGETALFISAHNNLEHIFRYLITLCDDQVVKIRSKSDMNAFHVAAKNGHLGIVNELLERWPELCRICDSTNTSPLYSAAVKEHLDVMNAILDADGTNMWIVRKNGKTVLHNAARYGRLNVVKVLIDRDPQIVREKDKKGQTALHMAVKGTGTHVVEEILSADISILNWRDKKGNTAIHIATRKLRPLIVHLLLSFSSIEVNAINKEQQTAMDLADTLPYGDSALEIREALADAGAKHAKHVGQLDEAMELKRTVSDIKHEVQSQFRQNEKTNRRVSGIAKELKKLHREAVQNTTNSVTVVAVLFASIAFLAIFNLPGLYVDDIDSEMGEAKIAGNVGFRVFCLLNATSLFISLAVVVVQITLVAWDTTAQKQVVSVVNKLMWAACACTCGAFLAIAFVVVGRNSWMAITITILGAPILVGTLASMCYFVFRQHFGAFRDNQRRIKRTSGSRSFSWSYSANISDIDAYNSDMEKIYAL